MTAGRIYSWPSRYSSNQFGSISRLRDSLRHGLRGASEARRGGQESAGNYSVSYSHLYWAGDAVPILHPQSH
jgi:hypothetical protein